MFRMCECPSEHESKRGATSGGRSARLAPLACNIHGTGSDQAHLACAACHPVLNAERAVNHNSSAGACAEPMLYDNGKFLSELYKLYEGNKADGSVWVTLKRSECRPARRTA